MRKNMKNKFIMMNESAVPLRVKRMSLVQEVVRRIRNCHRNIPREELGEILSTFCQKMRESGYGEKMRREVIDAGVKIYEELIQKEKEGVRPMYYLREENRKERNSVKTNKTEKLVEEREKERGREAVEDSYDLVP